MELTRTLAIQLLRGMGLSTTSLGTLTDVELGSNDKARLTEDNLPPWAAGYAAASAKNGERTDTDVTVPSGDWLEIVEGLTALDVKMHEVELRLRKYNLPNLTASHRNTMTALGTIQKLGLVIDRNNARRT